MSEVGREMGLGPVHRASHTLVMLAHYLFSLFFKLYKY